MFLDRLTISGFQCFAAPTEVLLSQEISCFIGNNGSGKTAIFQAITKLFGLGASRRNIQNTDFHLVPDVAEIQDGAEIIIDARFSFPELQDGADAGAVAEFWHQLGVNDSKGTLHARMILKAVWSDDGTPDGTIETSVRWIPTLDDNYTWAECQAVSAQERSSVQAVYVPATRGSDTQVRALLRNRLWRAAIWSPTLKTTAESNAADTRNAFIQDPVIRTIQSRLSARWDQVERGGATSRPAIELTESRFEAIIRQALIKFRHSEDGAPRELSSMSDGQKSLFEMALTAAILDLEKDINADTNDALPFDKALTRHVPLTLLLLEEPENSLSPFYLSRIMSMCEDIAGNVSAQACLSSHSPAILSRIEPDVIRYCRQDTTSGASSVSALTLPPTADEAGKYKHDRQYRRPQ